MSDQKSPARTKADAAFDEAQSQSRDRERTQIGVATPAGAQDEKTARLKAERLAKEAADQASR